MKIKRILGFSRDLAKVDSMDTLRQTDYQRRQMERRKIMRPRVLIDPSRVRRLEGSFAFIPHRFVRDGFWESLSVEQLVVYVFLVLAADRDGISFYGPRKLELLCKMDPGDDIDGILDELVRRDLIAREDIYTQVLSLPAAPSTRIDRGPREQVNRHPRENLGPVDLGRLVSDFVKKTEVLR